LLAVYAGVSLLRYETVLGDVYIKARKILIGLGSKMGSLQMNVGSQNWMAPKMAFHASQYVMASSLMESGSYMLLILIQSSWGLGIMRNYK
jgi:hypothetical protein